MFGKPSLSRGNLAGPGPPGLLRQPAASGADLRGSATR